MFLSIVIPVYNGENCIRRCLDSIWSQNINEDEYEVICVNDCSKDHTVEVVSDIQQNHSNLILVSTSENTRAGGGRNLGVKKAKGEYILFIDADDYFHSGALQTAVEYQKKNQLDILVCDFARHPLDEPNNRLVHNFKSQEIMTGREFLVTNSLPYAPWKYIFKRRLMTDNQVFFQEKVSCEDVDWSHKIAFYARTMQYRPVLLTHYILTDNSQTGMEYQNANTVFYRLQSGKRMAELLYLCHTEAERRQILGVAKRTMQYGLFFLNALFTSPANKVYVIKECVLKDVDWGLFVNVIRDNAGLYAYFSTMMAPFFKFVMKIRRKIRRR